MAEDEEFVALIHLGPPVEVPISKGRRLPAEYVTWLD